MDNSSWEFGLFSEALITSAIKDLSRMIIDMAFYPAKAVGKRI